MEYTVDIKNIGGIQKGNVVLTKGLNAVRASNWKGKSSFLGAIKTVMGTGTPLTESEGSGYVELEADAEQYRIELQRENGTIIKEGNPYITDEYSLTSAELFAFLDEGNEIREAVRRGENLEDLLTRPLDLEDIENRINELVRNRDQIDKELECVEQAAKRIPTIQERITQLEAKLDNLRAQRADIQTGQTDSSELIQKRDALSDLRAEKDSVENRIDRIESSIERNKAELESKREEMENHEIPDREDVVETLDNKREEIQRLEHDIELLQSLYSANKRIITEDRLDLITDVERSLLGDTVDCWVCGSNADTTTVKDQLDSLAERISKMETKADNQRERIEILQSELEEQRQAEKKEERLQQDISRLEEKIAEHEQSQASAYDRLEQLKTEINELSDQVDDLNDEMTDIESEIKVSERELSQSRDELNELQSEVNKKESLKAQREQVTTELAELRDRRDTIKQQLRDVFDESMEEILHRFDIGIDGARLTPQFDLIVARNGRKTSIDTLSEGERELLGVITALTGYEVFDVSDDLPIVLLDELGGFSEENLSTLVQYLEERVEYLVFTAYPEHDLTDATEIQLSEWELVSEKVTAS